LDFLQLGIEALSAGQRDDRIWEVLDSLRTPGKARRITCTPYFYFHPPDTAQKKMAALDVLQAHGSCPAATCWHNFHTIINAPKIGVSLVWRANERREGRLAVSFQQLNDEALAQACKRFGGS
jgi:hypothetical protein